MFNSPTKKERQPRRAKVEVSLPAVVGVALVQANQLQHYEIFFALFALALSTAASFWTSFFTSEPEKSALFWSATSFTLLTVFAGAVALYLRSKIFQKNIKRITPLDKIV